MRLLLAGWPFEVGPDEALTAADRASLERLRAPQRGADDSRAPVLALELVREPPWDADLHSYQDLAPSAVVPTADAIRLTHRRFVAELMPGSRTGRLFRSTAEPSPIGITLRAALCACLPGVGGLPLHAAGVLLEGRGVAFFGASGAGKSTIASLAPGPVFSDELVAVTLDPPTLRASGFWGETESLVVAPGAPLAALVELAQGPSLRLERLDPLAALRRLLRVVLVPPAPWLWTEALALAQRLARERPAYRMEWSPADPPWAELAETILGS